MKIPTFDPKPLTLELEDGSGKNPRLEVYLDEATSDTHDLYPTFLFTPDIDKFEHWHLTLTQKSAKELYVWLRDFLTEMKRIP